MPKRLRNTVLDLLNFHERAIFLRKLQSKKVCLESKQHKIPNVILKVIKVATIRWIYEKSGFTNTLISA